ncbi:hypothetical protein STRAU_6818 [Streptomyces aurantiacus JA 4570]|uniref:Uncharacterized protein n=1 Tax=Streptomyces aurantiacus JA 4570 TaxID=1286094 RepID=S3Z8W6_9ACTN|nr:hypothetical protein STRAU_6818 [Streptomyces aurantiacus JA 4570]
MLNIRHALSALPPHPSSSIKVPGDPRSRPKRLACP